ncbi:MAG: cell envelope integrity protein TolA [Rhodomicrobium sp.]
MRYGLIGSILIHIVVFGLVIFNFLSRSKDDAPAAVPVSVEIMAPKDYSERQAGKVDGKAEKPAPPAEVKASEAAANAKKEVAEQVPSPKPAEKETLAPPPPTPPAPAPAAKPVEQAKTEPKPEKPVEKPAPKKVAKKEPVHKPKPKPEARPGYKFDPNKIAAELKSDEDQPPPPPHTAQSNMETPPSKLYSDRQAAVLNRDPNAGAPAGDYDPSQPWRPASSLQDQAMGLSTAHGAMNAGTCADAIQSRIEQNWILPIGGQSAENTIVRLRIELKRDGYLLKPPIVMDPAYSPVQQAMADAAIRAAESGQPFIVPPQQYEQCRDLILRFNPHDMYGG